MKSDISFYNEMMKTICTHKDSGKRNPVDIGVECGYSEEEVMKLLYLVSAVVITVIGIGTLFETFIGGLLVIVVGNIALRVGYELMMMFIILCRKTVSIDRKLEKMTGSCDDDTAGGECRRGEKTEDGSPETETADEDRINQSER